MKDVKAPNLVIIGVLTVITIAFWIVYGIYKLLSNPQAVSVESAIIEPLSPTLNRDALSTLEQRIFFSEAEIGESVISIPSPSPSPTPEESPLPSPGSEEDSTATESATENQESTGSATTQ